MEAEAFKKHWEESYVDDQHAPEVFASGVAGMAFDGPNIHITFFSTRVNHGTSPGPLKNVVTARVVVPVAVAAQLGVDLREFASSAKLNTTNKPIDQLLQ